MSDKKPRMVWADDGNAFQCEGCGVSVPRTRANPYPSHTCATPTGEALGVIPKCPHCDGHGAREEVKTMLTLCEHCKDVGALASSQPTGEQK